MCSSASAARPANVLKLFIPFYYKTIVQVDKSGVGNFIESSFLLLNIYHFAEGLQSLSEGQLRWHLTILANLVETTGNHT